MTNYTSGYQNTFRAAGLAKYASSYGIANAMLDGAGFAIGANSGYQEHNSVGGAVGAGAGTVGGGYAGARAGSAISDGLKIKHPLGRWILPTVLGTAASAGGYNVGGKGGNEIQKRMENR